MYACKVSSGYWNMAGSKLFTRCFLLMLCFNDNHSCDFETVLFYVRGFLVSDADLMD
ncbi:unnamed protein product [Callosobruchus maculatus]|uniref:Uncharacterized protein n=1 Tax=Callosobruchus maculatus TaxID=64391 RepID=A0A653BRG6_CALMS|nr:unnamed protein product [Callosobruchus maculatus]